MQATTIIQIFPKVGDVYEIHVDRSLTEEEIKSFINTHCQSVDHYKARCPGAMFAGKLYSGDVFIGPIQADSLHSLKRTATLKCNKHYKRNHCDRLIDRMVLTRFDGKETGEHPLTMVYFEGQWQWK